MEIKNNNYYRLLTPRPAVLISTRDSEGNNNAAPFSFIMPVSVEPPIISFASAPNRHTLANIRETGEFVINIVPSELIEKIWICSKSFGKNVSEIEKASLREKRSVKVAAPGVQECVAWIECELEEEKQSGDHIVVFGRVVNTSAVEGYIREGSYLDIVKCHPLLHVGGKDFTIPGQLITIVEKEEDAGK